MNPLLQEATVLTYFLRKSLAFITCTCYAVPNSSKMEKRWQYIFLDFYRIFSIPVSVLFTAGIFYFIAIHLEIKWKKDLCRENPFSVWKMGFFHTEKGFLQRKAFPNPLEVQVNCSEQCPATKEGVAPAIAGDLLNIIWI